MLRRKSKRSTASLMPVSQAVRPIVKKLLPEKNILFQQLFEVWPDLVAGTEAVGAIPEKLALARNQQKNGVLYLWALSGAQAMEISFNKMALLQKINTAFGYALLSDVRVTAFPTANAKLAESVPVSVPAARASCQSLDKDMGTISNPHLRAALAGLGGVLSPEHSEMTMKKGQHHA